MKWDHEEFNGSGTVAVTDNAGGNDDVKCGDSCGEAVRWAAKNGITGGIGDGLFGPARSCTRGQIVTFLYRAYSKQ